MSIKLIASDVDGTILNTPHTGLISPRNKAAIDAARSRGITVSIATGRGNAAALQFAHSLGLDGPVISSNGACVSDGKTIYAKHCLPDQTLMDALAFGKKYRCIPIFFTHICLFFPTDEEGGENVGDYVCKWLGTCEADEEMRPMPPSMREEVFHGLGVTKILFACETQEYANALRPVWEDLVARGEIPDLADVVVSYHNSFDLAVRGVSKGTAVAELVQALGLKRGEVFAIGDNENDTGMFEYAGISVAMGHSRDSVKEKATYVTDTVVGDGFAKALEQYVLK